MIDFIASINWSVNPIAFRIFGHPIAWYGILWATGVALTAYVVYRMFKHEKYPEEWFDSFFMHVVVALLIGARLGHCLFYQPVEYLSNPIELIKVWEGGLASHGGAIGMLIGVCVFSLKKTKTKINWKIIAIAALIGAIVGRIGHSIFNPNETFSFIDMNNDLMLGAIIMGLFVGTCVAFVYISSPKCIEMLDRLIVGVCIGATAIRLGNLMNSEIFGGHTSLPWGFNFLNSDQWLGMGALPCHPTQLYEALIYFSLFLITMFLYWKTNAKDKTGLLLGIALSGIFGSRILIETIKNVQVSFEEDMLLNMGQLLSLPFLIWGIWLIWNAFRQKKKSPKNK